MLLLQEPEEKLQALRHGGRDILNIGRLRFAQAARSLKEFDVEADGPHEKVDIGQPSRSHAGW